MVRFGPKEVVGGPKLRLLCLHGNAQTGNVFRKQLEAVFSGDYELRSSLNLVMIEAPEAVPAGEVPADSMSLCIVHGGEPRQWFQCRRQGEVGEQRLGFDQALAHAAAVVKKKGPFDGLCGWQEGGDVVAQLARLACEGDADLAGQFRFVLLLGATWPKEQLYRPKAPLDIPCCHIYSTAGPRSIADFEYMSLHWQPDRREVIPISQTKMPRLESECLGKLRRFLAPFRQDVGTDEADDGDAPGGCAAGSLGSRLLPIQRPLGMKALPVGGQVLMVCFHDILHDALGPYAFDGLAGRIAVVKDFKDRLSLDVPQLSNFVSIDHIIPEPVLRPDLLAKDFPDRCVEEPAIAAAERIARNYLATTGGLGGLPIAIVGIGFGAYVGLKFAEMLRVAGKEIEWNERGSESDAKPRPVTGRVIGLRPAGEDGISDLTELLEIGDPPTGRRWVHLDEDTMTLSDELGSVDVPYKVLQHPCGNPWAFYAVRPPALFPPPPPGALGDCAITCLLEPSDTAGDRWRFETSAVGHFSVEVVQPGADAWSEAVTASLRQAFAASAARNV